MKRMHTFKSIVEVILLDRSEQLKFRITMLGCVMLKGMHTSSWPGTVIISEICVSLKLNGTLEFSDVELLIAVEMGNTNVAHDKKIIKARIPCIYFKFLTSKREKNRQAQDYVAFTSQIGCETPFVPACPFV